MANIENSISSLSVNGGGISNVEEQVSKQRCGGINVYTARNNFRRENTKKNHSVGSIYRFEKPNAYDASEYFHFEDGIIRTAGTPTIMTIGDIYSIDDSASNADKNFTSILDFTELEHHIAQVNYSKNQGENYIIGKYGNIPQINPENYKTEDVDAAMFSQMPNLGEEVQIFKYPLHSPVIQNHGKVSDYCQSLINKAKEFQIEQASKIVSYELLKIGGTSIDEFGTKVDLEKSQLKGDILRSITNTDSANKSENGVSDYYRNDRENAIEYGTHQWSRIVNEELSRLAIDHSEDRGELVDIEGSQLRDNVIKDLDSSDSANKKEGGLFNYNRRNREDIILYYWAQKNPKIIDAVKALKGERFIEDFGELAEVRLAQDKKNVLASIINATSTSKINSIFGEGGIYDFYEEYRTNAVDVLPQKLGLKQPWSYNNPYSNIFDGIGIERVGFDSIGGEKRGGRPSGATQVSTNYLDINGLKAQHKEKYWDLVDKTVYLNGKEQDTPTQSYIKNEIGEEIVGFDNDGLESRHGSFKVHDRQIDTSPIDKFGISVNGSRDRNRLLAESQTLDKIEHYFPNTADSNDDGNTYGFEDNERIVGFDKKGIETNHGKLNASITKNNEGKLGDHTSYQEYSGAIQKSETIDNIGYTQIDSNSGKHSNLIKKTNKLFNEGKIGTLVNRFHTTSDSDGNMPYDFNNSEIASSYDKVYGMSRGRNLLKANPKNNGDSGYDNPYCRVWTAHHQYSHLKDRIRPFYDGDKPMGIKETQSKYGLMRPNNGNERLDKNSVLMPNGFVKMSPTKEDFEQTGSTNMKKYMFSIENLAWKDFIKLDKDAYNPLSKEQIGPNNGRIMWFPPYNLKFSENISVNWNANQFIGRGEQIYTYTNTERSGTLNFTILIDHPSIINKWRNSFGVVEGQEKEKREQEILRFFAGCGNLDEDIPDEPVADEPEPKEQHPSVEPTPNRQSAKIGYVVFFPNDFSAYDYYNASSGEGKEKIENSIDRLRKYEVNTGDANFEERDNAYEDEILAKHNSANTNSVRCLNKPVTTGVTSDVKSKLFRDGDVKVRFLETTEIDGKTYSGLTELNKEIVGDTIFGFPKETFSIDSVTVKGFASDHGYQKNNEALCMKRAKFMESVIQVMSNGAIGSEKFKEETGTILHVDDPDGKKDINRDDAKLARAAYAIFNVSWNEDMKPSTDDGVQGDGVHESVEEEGVVTYGSGVVPEENVSEPQVVEEKNETVMKTSYDDKMTYDNEHFYFENLKDNDRISYDKIVDKIKYFNPAFHSITPEGFNARLTFLHQCTRQGPTASVASGLVNKNSPDYLKYAGNLAFGRAPYCVLRIGDFFNTKICIDSLSIDYDTGGGIQWDLNPEGAGVQPMMANINIGFKFLGGQDISGPIERLQNAVTANFYANASVYDRHADTDTSYYDVSKDNIGTNDADKTGGRISKIVTSNNKTE